MRVDNNDLLLIGMLALAAISAGAVVYLLIAPYISGDRTDKRIQAATENKGRRIGIKQQAEVANNRRRQVADTLKDLEDRQKQREKVSLRLKLQRAGLDMTPRSFWLASVASGLIVGVGAWAAAPNFPIVVPMLAAFVGFLGLPRWILARVIKRRQYKFTEEFANSIDIIVRGVKSGLPLIECLNIIARESPQPIAGEFTELVEQQRVGVPLGEAFEKMMVRVPLAEVRFFAIVISIQQQAGGNLSEALGNLCRRPRRAAVHRHAARLRHDACIHRAALDNEVRSVSAGGRRMLDDLRRAHDEEDDQLQILELAWHDLRVVRPWIPYSH
jgi:tight adherence protein B